jgi:hypothetical protein
VRWALGAAVALLVTAAAIGVVLVHAPSGEGRPSILVTRINGPKVDCLETRVVREDRASLTPIESSVRVKGAFEQPAYSTDRKAVALGGDTGTVIVVDAADLKVRATVRVASADADVRVVSWPARDRLVAISYTASATRPYVTRVVALDPTDGEIVSSKNFPEADALSGGATRSGRVPLLIVSRRALGPPRIAVVGAQGIMRTGALGRLRAGSTTKQPYRLRSPGFAVDGQEERAFIVDPSGLVAEVRLGSLAVRYRKVKGLVSKNPALPDRRRVATWLGSGRIAISGSDDDPPLFYSPSASFASSASWPPSSFTPFGLRILDTRNWQLRMLDPRPSTFEWLRGRLVAYGRTVGAEAARPDETVVAFDPNGRLVYAIHGNKNTYWEAFDGRLFLMRPHSQLLEVRDARDGRVLGHVTGQSFAGRGPC